MQQSSYVPWSNWPRFIKLSELSKFACKFLLSHCTHVIKMEPWQLITVFDCLNNSKWKVILWDVRILRLVMFCYIFFPNKIFLQMWVILQVCRNIFSPCTRPHYADVFILSWWPTSEVGTWIHSPLGYFVTQLTHTWDPVAWLITVYTRI